MIHSYREPETLVEILESCEKRFIIEILSDRKLTQQTSPEPNLALTIRAAQLLQDKYDRVRVLEKTEKGVVALWPRIERAS